MDAHAVTRDRAKRLRAEMDLPERLLWKRLNRGQLGGLHFRRQHPVNPYILDFYCDAARLAVEVDGYSHGVLVARSMTSAATNGWKNRGSPLYGSPPAMC